MTSKPPIDDVSNIKSLPDAINLIKFLKISHKAELAKWMETCKRQARIIKKLESNRTQELAFLANQLRNYEVDLHSKEEVIAKQFAEKDETIERLNLTVESLQNELDDFLRTNRSISTSDSGIIEDKTDADSKTDESNQSSMKTQKKRHSSFTKSINFLRKVDFSSKICKNTDSPKQKTKKPSSFRTASNSWMLLDKTSSDDEHSSADDVATFFVPLPRKMDDSMINHYCEELTESEQEQMFNRVMIRNSKRRSVKTNVKYQKISRNKSKYLEEIRNACEFTVS